VYVAITLFTLADGCTLDEYERFARDFIGPRMLELPSVRGFRDGRSVRKMGGAAAGWDGLEVIEITSPAEFEDDHEVEPGKAVAARWMEWIDSYEVTFFRLINDA